MQNYSVYEHVNKQNSKRYIGITKQQPERRWGTNGINYKDKCPHFWNAICKYGWDQFQHNIIASGLSKEQACDMQMQLIKQYQTQNNKFGYNILQGGNAPSITQQTRKKMSCAMLGNKNGLNKPCTEEKRKKIGDAQKGRKFTQQHKENIAKAKKGKSHAPISIEARKKIADKHQKKKVFCKETNTVYPSIQECARELGIDATAVCACCKGRHKSTSGYHFNYYNDDV